MIPARSILVLQGLLGLISFSDAFDPISATIGLGIAAGVGVKWKDQIADYTLCKFYECCRKPYLKSDVEGLKLNLTQHLFGQHIVQDVLVNAIGAHFDTIESSRKPLVMSFHGTSGTGKNYVSDFVAAALFEKGIESNFVYKFTATNTDKDLADKVKETVKKCEYSLFIFDEIEKMPTGVFDSIVSLLDHHSYLKGYDFSKAIFIFLSNSAGAEIAKKLKSLMDAGRYRDETELEDFQYIAQLGAYNVQGGLHRSKLIDSHVIDHFVPFLPLEPRHVEMCIKKEFMLRSCPNEASDEDFRKIIKDAMTYDDTKKFSNNGCKRISKKVESYCYQQKMKSQH
nr:torsin-like protein isoform X2 [Aedes albopictus]